MNTVYQLNDRVSVCTSTGDKVGRIAEVVGSGYYGIMPDDGTELFYSLDVFITLIARAIQVIGPVTSTTATNNHNPDDYDDNDDDDDWEDDDDADDDDDDDWEDDDDDADDADDDEDDDDDDEDDDDDDDDDDDEDDDEDDDDDEDEEEDNGQDETCEFSGIIESAAAPDYNKADNQGDEALSERQEEHTRRQVVLSHAVEHTLAVSDDGHVGIDISHLGWYAIVDGRAVHVLKLLPDNRVSVERVFGGHVDICPASILEPYRVVYPYER